MYFHICCSIFNGKVSFESHVNSEASIVRLIHQYLQTPFRRSTSRKNLPSNGNYVVRLYISNKKYTIKYISEWFTKFVPIYIANKEKEHKKRLSPFDLSIDDKNQWDFFFEKEIKFGSEVYTSKDKLIWSISFTNIELIK